MLTKQGIFHLFLSTLAYLQVFAILYFIFQAVTRIVELRSVDQVAWIFLGISILFGAFAWALFRAARGFTQLT